MLGLRSCIFQSDDITAVSTWYKKVLETDPYFENENYIGFDIGWYELGIFKRESSYISSGNNVEIYWGVEDISSQLKKLLSLWAKLESPLTDVGWDIIMASVRDPFGNIFGLIYNPNFSLHS